jgi:hypothetical protein
MDAATAIFRHGPDFVGADTVKNPLPSCAEPALEDSAFRLCRREAMPFVDDVGHRLLLGIRVSSNSNTPEIAPLSSELQNWRLISICAGGKSDDAYCCAASIVWRPSIGEIYIGAGIQGDVPERP